MAFFLCIIFGFLSAEVTTMERGKVFAEKANVTAALQDKEKIIVHYMSEMLVALSGLGATCALDTFNCVSGFVDEFTESLEGLSAEEFWPAWHKARQNFVHKVKGCFGDPKIIHSVTLSVDYYLDEMAKRFVSLSD